MANVDSEMFDEFGMGALGQWKLNIEQQNPNYSHKVYKKKTRSGGATGYQHA